MEILTGGLILVMMTIVVVVITVRSPEFKEFVARASKSNLKEDKNVSS
jgi:hypothetical protein